MVAFISPIRSPFKAWPYYTKHDLLAYKHATAFLDRCLRAGRGNHADEPYIVGGKSRDGVHLWWHISSWCDAADPATPEQVSRIMYQIEFDVRADDIDSDDPVFVTSSVTINGEELIRLRHPWHEPAAILQ